MSGVFRAIRKFVGEQTGLVRERELEELSYFQSLNDTDSLRQEESMIEADFSFDSGFDSGFSDSGFDF